MKTLGINLINSLNNNNMISFEALRKSNIKKSDNSNLSLKSSSVDSFTRNDKAKDKAVCMERNIVVTYDDVFIFETPKQGK